MIEADRRAVSAMLKAVNQRFVVQDEAKMAQIRENFLPEFSLDIVQNPNATVELLEAAWAEHNPEDLELTLGVISVFALFEDGYTREYADVMLRLLECDWHECHEDIAFRIERMRPPEAVEPLYRTALARYPYLDYDEAYALGVKCVWGLGEIGTPEAVGRLRLLAACDNEVIRENAAYQLERLGASHGQG